MMNGPPDDNRDATPPPVPGSAREIPGLGPIRVRALIKAGLGDVQALRAATLEQLTAVPGMSEIKARHIKSFLAQFTEEELNAAATAAEQQRNPYQPEPCAAAPSDAVVLPLVPGKEATVILRFAEVPHTSAAVAGEGELVLNLALTLLLAEAAPGYRARLLRETVAFMQLVKVLLQCTLPDAKAEERALRRLQTVSAALKHAVADPELDRKAQTRLANELAQAGDRLETLIGQTLRRRSVETADE